MGENIGKIIQVLGACGGVENFINSLGSMADMVGGSQCKGDDEPVVAYLFCDRRCIDILHEPTGTVIEDSGE